MKLTSSTLANSHCLIALILCCNSRAKKQFRVTRPIICNDIKLEGRATSSLSSTN